MHRTGQGQASWCDTLSAGVKEPLTVSVGSENTKSRVSQNRVSVRTVVTLCPTRPLFSKCFQDTLIWSMWICKENAAFKLFLSFPSTHRIAVISYSYIRIVSADNNNVINHLNSWIVEIDHQYTVRHTCVLYYQDICGEKGLLLFSPFIALAKYSNTQIPFSPGKCLTCHELLPTWSL